VVGVDAAADADRGLDKVSGCDAPKEVGTGGGRT
jgi:hypothetical protein